MNFKSSPVFLTTVTIIIIIFAIVITASVQSQTPKKEASFSKIITVGPVWTSDTWACTSDKDFVVHGALRGLNGSQLEISISDLGTQSLYTLDAGKLETFSIGAAGGHAMSITRTIAPITGWLTLQTESDANASCIQR